MGYRETIAFKLTQNQVDKLNKWASHCKGETTLGGRLSYIFTPTGFGPIVEVRCQCGKSLDLTDVDNW